GDCLLAFSVLQLLMRIGYHRSKRRSDSVNQPCLHISPVQLVERQIARDFEKPEPDLRTRYRVRARSDQSEEAFLREFLRNSALSGEALEKPAQSWVHLFNDVFKDVLDGILKAVLQNFPLKDLFRIQLFACHTGLPLYKTSEQIESYRPHRLRGQNPKPGHPQRVICR